MFLVAAFMLAAKDVIRCKHVDWLVCYQPLLIFTKGVAVSTAEVVSLMHSKSTGYPLSYHA